MTPTYDADLFGDEALDDPYGHYRTLRDLGPVVRLTAHDVYAVTRYADVRAVLEDPEAFCSGLGVGFNDFINEAGRGTTLMSDGDQHERLRDVIGRPLTPKALAEQCPFAIIDYLAPSLDTTISAIGNAIWLFATHPDQWQLLRREPERIKHAFNETLRMETPISAFTRVTTRDAVVDGVVLPAGARVMLSYASANRDERHWDNADVFDISRNSASQIAFGYGEHACAGMGLARLEGAAVLAALVARVDRFELTGEPVRKLNNLIRSFASLPVAVTPA